MPMTRTKVRGRRYASILLFALLLALVASFALAQESTPGLIARMGSQVPVEKAEISAVTTGMYENWQAMQERSRESIARERSQPAGSPLRLPVARPDYQTQSLTADEVCGNIIANSQLNILEFGDGYGSAEPWAFLIPQLYYVNENDPNIGILAFDGYSLIFEEGDVGDPSPTVDLFAQGFLMPGNLTSIRAVYWRMSIDSNINDEVWGELWLLDNNGYLHLDDPDQYLVGYWEVFESELEWNQEAVVATEGIVNALKGRPAALLFYNYTDGSDPSAPEAEKEWMLMDDIVLEICYKAATVTGKRTYLPLIQKKGVTAASCTPPNENPQDQWNANRGVTQTGATCKSTLSELDRADYYTFKPTKSGSHTLHLGKLLAGTEWSAMIFVDSDSPNYAPGATEGQCRIATPGAIDKKVTCSLTKDTGYFIKVSAGSTPVKGPYEMKVVTP
jgi:hypothetical protein